VNRWGVIGLLSLLSSTAVAAPDIVGHRGTGVDADDNPYAENSLSSFARARDEGVDVVELDVRQAADGALFVLHDDTVDRTTTGSGCVGDLTAVELQSLELLRTDGETLFTLDDALGAIDLPFNIELKVGNSGGECPGTDRSAMARDVVAAIRESGRDHQVSSFDLEVLALVGDQGPGIYRGLLSLDPDDASVAAGEGLEGLHLFSPLVSTTDDVDAVHDLGLRLQVWTENDPTRAAPLAELGVDGIITDEPDLMRAALPQADGGCTATNGRPGRPWFAALVALALWARRRRRDTPGAGPG